MIAGGFFIVMSVLFFTVVTSWSRYRVLPRWQAVLMLLGLEMIVLGVSMWLWRSVP